MDSDTQRPRPDRTPQDAERIRIKNRRLEYLRRNPAYVASSDREFVNVALYNKLVRSFQTPAERTAEAMTKGFGQVLEASILRNPEPLNSAVDADDMVEEEDEGGDVWTGQAPSQIRNGEEEEDEDEDEDSDDGTGTAESAQEAARQRWYAYVRDWFVRGAADEDGFDYATVDDDSDYDTLERTAAQDAWFDEEEPGWASADDDDGTGPRERVLAGQSGVQDF